MKTVKREGVFETNSSSSHSISIASSNKVHPTVLRNSLARINKPLALLNTLGVIDGKVVIEEGEFGWGYSTHSDALTKASYCLTDSRDNQYRKEMLKRVIEQHCNCVVEFGTTVGYVDHQSYGTSADAFTSDEMLRDFIFNPYSILTLDNDNH